MVSSNISPPFATRRLLPLHDHFRYTNLITLRTSEHDLSICKESVLSTLRVLYIHIAGHQPAIESLPPMARLQVLHIVVPGDWETRKTPLVNATGAPALKRVVIRIDRWLYSNIASLRALVSPATISSTQPEIEICPIDREFIYRKDLEL